MSEAAASRLLSREREELDTIALSIREGRRIVAFLVCGVDLRAEVAAYLSGASGRVVPLPVEAKDPASMLSLLTEAAALRSGEIRSVSVAPEEEETVRALNWHREKLRKGASLLVWMEGCSKEGEGSGEEGCRRSQEGWALFSRSSRRR